MFAAVTCNDFYANCEQVFRPDLRGKPVVVLSDNDDCIVAHSKEAKALGISLRQSFFKIENLLRRHRVAVFSSNYPLYGDLSRRVMNTLQEFDAPVEVYGIDEMFLDITGHQSDELAPLIRRTLWQELRIPASVGLAPTRTLARLAARVAKKVPVCHDVCTLDQPYKWHWVLERTAAREIWGVGGRLGSRLRSLGIHSALDLAGADPGILRRHGGVNLECIIKELNGHPCLTRDDLPAARHQTYSTGSFGSRPRSGTPLQEALAYHAARAAEKLRARRHLARAVHVFMHTAPHEPGYRSASAVVQLPCPGNDAGIIVAAARQLAKGLCQPRSAFLTVGVGLLDPIDRRHHQLGLLNPGPSARNDTLAGAPTTFSRKPGHGASLVANGNLHRPRAMGRQFHSPRYTTHWQEVPQVKA